MKLLPDNLRQLKDFDSSRTSSMPREQLNAVRKAALGLRERFLDEPHVTFYAAIDLVRVPYPVWYAYTGVYAQGSFRFPYLHLLNRLFVVQYRDFNQDLRILLFSPSDVEGNRQTPFFQRLAERVPSRRLQNIVAPIYRSVPDALRELGISPVDVDYISYDHLHTQDLRTWLGDGKQPGVFPNAKLLVHEREWSSVRALLPCQADWYCPHGTEGVTADKVIAFDGSIQLGRGVALLHTPGHTAGNHSLLARVVDGLRVSSENGVSLDAYAPQNSRINAIRRYAKSTGVEVILNGNTLEGSTDQYISMVLEKTVAGPSANADFPNCATSSEATPHPLMPGAVASHLMGPAKFGKLMPARRGRPQW